MIEKLMKTKKCKHCCLPITNGSTVLCGVCNYDDTVTISKTDVKRIYKVDDTDLSEYVSKGGYHMSYVVRSYCRRVIGTRYRIEDIEHFIEKKSKCSDDDKRYRALQKVRKIREEQIEEERKKVETINNMKMLVRIMIEKSDHIDLIDLMKRIIDDERMINIGQMIVEDNLAESCDKIMQKVETIALTVEELNHRVKIKYEKKYDKCIKILDSDPTIYISYIDKTIGIVDFFNQIDRKLSEDQKKKRTTRIENLLKKQNADICKDANFYEYARKNSRYKKYVNDGTAGTTLDSTVSKIGSVVRTKIEKEQRERLIKKRLKAKYHTDEYHMIMRSENIYRNYVDANEGELENVFDVLCEKIETVRAREIKSTKLKNEIRMNKINITDDKITKSEICDRYMKNDNVDLKEVVKDLIDMYGLKKQKVRQQPTVEKRIRASGVDIAKFKRIIGDFKSSGLKKIQLTGYRGEELQLLVLLCQNNGYTYKRLNKLNVLITK